jgi:hypothetical protein
MIFLQKIPLLYSYIVWSIANFPKKTLMGLKRDPQMSKMIAQILPDGCMRSGCIIYFEFSITNKKFVAFRFEAFLKIKSQVEFSLNFDIMNYGNDIAI